MSLSSQHSHIKLPSCYMRGLQGQQRQVRHWKNNTVFGLRDYINTFTISVLNQFLQQTFIDFIFYFFQINTHASKELLKMLEFQNHL